MRQQTTILSYSKNLEREHTTHVKADSEKKSRKTFLYCFSISSLKQQPVRSVFVCRFLVVYLMAEESQEFIALVDSRAGQ